MYVVIAQKRAREIYKNIISKIKKDKVESFANIRTIRLKETHIKNGIYLTLDGKPINAFDFK